ncbi:hypothetical protein B566_EDAN001608, partial [Ephemera danica]
QLQDSYGDTALHDAIGKENQEIVEVLCSVPGVDFTLRNKRGFNVLHHAALKGNNFATEKLLTRTRQLVDVKKDDGFSALHLACLNGHEAIANTLIVQGQADLDLRNNRKQTPLMLAVSQGHYGVVELMVMMKSSFYATDEDGDTALHLAIMKMVTQPSSENPISFSEAPHMSQIWGWLVTKNPELSTGLAAACYLALKGWDLNKKNNKGKTPLECIPESFPLCSDIIECLHLASQKAFGQLPGMQAVAAPAVEPVDSMEECQAAKVVEPPAPPVSLDLHTECSICSELDKNIVFEPCGHQIACEECAARMKRCIICHQTIVRQVTKDGRTLACKERQSSAERLKYLESKIAEIEETHCCSICMERRRNVAFLCGHGSCEPCAQTLKTCHMCRKTITKKINLY